MEVWLEVIKAFGVPVACLIAIAWALWSAGRWLGVNVVKPVTDRHITFLNEVQRSLDKTVADNQKNTRNNVRAARSLRAVSKEVKIIAREVGSLTKKVQDVHNLVINADNVNISPNVPKGKGDDGKQRPPPRVGGG